MDYTTLTNAVIENLEIDSADLTRFKVLSSLNSAQLTLLQVLPVEHLTNAIATSKFNLVSGQVAYQWPCDFVRVVSIWVDFANPITIANTGTQATLWEEELFWETIDTIAHTYFPFYDPHLEGGFEIRPTPSINVSNGGRIRYVWKITDISVSQKSLLAPKLQNLLIFRATHLSALVEAYNIELAERYKRLYDEELAKFLPKEETK